MVSGFSGFTVVFACRNAMTPERATPTPAKAIAIAVVIRIELSSSIDGVAFEIAHIKTATSSATMGGGILSSSACIRRTEA